MFCPKSHRPEHNRDILPGASNLDSACWNNSSCLCPLLCHCPLDCTMSPFSWDRQAHHTTEIQRDVHACWRKSLFSRPCTFICPQCTHQSWAGKCLPFSCITPLIMAQKDSQRVCNPWVHSRLRELTWPEDWPLLWQNKDVNPQLLCYCPSPPGVPVSFPN